MHRLNSQTTVLSIISDTGLIELYKVGDGYIFFQKEVHLIEGIPEPFFKFVSLNFHSFQEAFEKLYLHNQIFKAKLNFVHPDIENELIKIASPILLVNGTSLNPSWILMLNEEKTNPHLP